MNLFDHITMIYVAPITFFGQTAILACDGQCQLNPKIDQTFPKPCLDPKYFPTRFCARDCPRSFLSQPNEDLKKYEPFISVIPIKNEHIQQDLNFLQKIIKKWTNNKELDDE